MPHPPSSPGRCRSHFRSRFRFLRLFSRLYVDLIGVQRLTVISGETEQATLWSDLPRDSECGKGVAGGCVPWHSTLKKNAAEALKWMQKSAALGFADAIEELKKMTSNPSR